MSGEEEVPTRHIDDRAGNLTGGVQSALKSSCFVGRSIPLGAELANVEPPARIVVGSKGWADK